MTNDEMLYIGEAAAMLGVHPDTLRRWDRSGQLRARRDRMGNRRYTRRELDRARGRLH